MDPSGRSSRILLAGLGESVADRYQEALDAIGCEVHRTGWSYGALGLALKTRYCAVVVGHPPVRPPSLYELMAVIRAADCSCRRAGVVLVASEREAFGARKLLRTGVNRVLTSTADTGAIRATVAQVSTAAPRWPLQVVARIVLELGDRAQQLICMTEDVSTSGMLLCVNRLLPAGAPVRFSLPLPGEPKPLRGTGVVSRSAPAAGDRSAVFATRFDHFRAQHRSRLSRFLARRLIHQ